jgi:hypothetical protein
MRIIYMCVPPPIHGNAPLLEVGNRMHFAAMIVSRKHPQQADIRIGAFFAPAGVYMAYLLNTLVGKESHQPTQEII